MNRSTRVVAAVAVLAGAAVAAVPAGAVPGAGRPAPVPAASAAPAAPVIQGARLAGIEQDFAREWAADGKNVVGDPIVTYLSDQEVRLLWLTDGRELCTGESTELGRIRLCSDPRHFPVDGTPHLQTVWGPGSTDRGFLTVFLADQETARWLTCGGVTSELRAVGVVRSGGGAALTVYSYRTPWWPEGTLRADVVRDGVPATEQVSLPTFGSAERDWLRSCDPRAPKQVADDAVPADDGTSGAPVVIVH